MYIIQFDLLGGVVLLATLGSRPVFYRRELGKPLTNIEPHVFGIADGKVVAGFESFEVVYDLKKKLCGKAVHRSTSGFSLIPMSFVRLNPSDVNTPKEASDALT